MPATRKPSRVPIEPLRTAYEGSGLAAGTVCRRLGWVRKCGTPKSTDLKRRLGIKPNQKVNPATGHVTVTRPTTINRAEARKVCAALGVDFYEVYEGIVKPPHAKGGFCRCCGEKLARHSPEGLCGWCIEERDGVRLEVVGPA